MADRWDDRQNWTTAFETGRPGYCVTHQLINGHPHPNRFLLLLLAVVAGFVVQTCAQTATTGGLEGVVMDPSGAYVAGATITLVNQQTGRSDSVTADKEGRFGFSCCHPETMSWKRVKQILSLLPATLSPFRSRKPQAWNCACESRPWSVSSAFQASLLLSKPTTPL